MPFAFNENAFMSGLESARQERLAREAGSALPELLPPGSPMQGQLQQMQPQKLAAMILTNPNLLTQLPSQAFDAMLQGRSLDINAALRMSELEQKQAEADASRRFREREVRVKEEGAGLERQRFAAETQRQAEMDRAIRNVLGALPADLSPDRRAAAEAALRAGSPAQALQAIGLTEPGGVTVNLPGENARAKIEGEAVARATTERLPSVRNELAQLDVMDKMLERGLRTGQLKEFLAGAANFFGVAPGEMADLGAFRSIANLQTLQRSTVLKGAISDREIGFISQSVPNAANAAEANKAIIEINRSLLEREREALRLQERYYTANGTLEGFDRWLSEWAEQNPLFSLEQQDRLQSLMIGTAEASEAPLVQTQEQYERLPPGATYQAGDGVIRRKGGG